MIPFRPTVERTWEAIHSLRYDRREEQGYEVVMGPDLYYDWLRDKDFWQYGYRGISLRGTHTAEIFGLPIEIDPSTPRGWIRLRHQVEA